MTCPSSRSHCQTCQTLDRPLTHLETYTGCGFDTPDRPFARTCARESRSRPLCMFSNRCVRSVRSGKALQFLALRLPHLSGRGLAGLAGRGSPGNVAPDASSPALLNQALLRAEQRQERGLGVAQWMRSRDALPALLRPLARAGANRAPITVIPNAAHGIERQWGCAQRAVLVEPDAGGQVCSHARGTRGVCEAGRSRVLPRGCDHGKEGPQSLASHGVLARGLCGDLHPSSNPTLRIWSCSDR